MNNEAKNEWLSVIRPQNGFWDLKLKEIAEYRQLIWLFVKRNYSTKYKQMILGPLWLIISPLLTMIAYTIVFGNIANLSTDGVPRPLFYLAGTILWSFFQNNVNTNSNTFVMNAPLFGKIYFPRMVVPISNVIIFVFDYLVQFGILLVMMCVYRFAYGYEFSANRTFAFFPLYLLMLGVMGMSVVIIISSLTTKYKDLIVLVGFGLHIWMYGSPVVYSLSLIPSEYQKIYMLNPVTPVLIAFKYSLFGVGTFPGIYLMLSTVFTVVVTIIGLGLFNHVEKTFMDTI